MGDSLLQQNIETVNRQLLSRTEATAGGNQNRQVFLPLPIWSENPVIYRLPFPLLPVPKKKPPNQVTQLLETLAKFKFRL